MSIQSNKQFFAQLGMSTPLRLHSLLNLCARVYIILNSHKKNLNIFIINESIISIIMLFWEKKYCAVCFCPIFYCGLLKRWSWYNCDHMITYSCHKYFVPLLPLIFPSYHRQNLTYMDWEKINYSFIILNFHPSTIVNFGFFNKMHFFCTF